jgi:hypothetical protein
MIFIAGFIFGVVMMLLRYRFPLFLARKSISSAKPVEQSTEAPSYPAKAHQQFGEALIDALKSVKYTQRTPKAPAPWKCPATNCRIRAKHSHVGDLIRRIKGK